VVTAMAATGRVSSALMTHGRNRTIQQQQQIFMLACLLQRMHKKGHMNVDIALVASGDGGEQAALLAF